MQSLQEPMTSGLGNDAVGQDFRRRGFDRASAVREGHARTRLRYRGCRRHIESGVCNLVFPIRLSVLMRHCGRSV